MSDVQPDEGSEPQASLENARRRRQPQELGGHLNEFEVFWRDNYQWLAGQGYQLRSRYQPDWRPSWEGTKKEFYECSDGVINPYPSLVDAQRISDGELLYLKRVDKTIHPYEAEIGQFFSTGALSKDPRNHCVPIYEVLQCPNDESALILVMPMLMEYSSPAFSTIGEVVEFFHQIFEGLQFMHMNNVAHRDVAHFNVLMDARKLFIDRYHPFRPYFKLDMDGRPRYHTRTSMPVRYYLADFGLSRKYRPEDRPPLEDVIVGGDKTVPEFETMDACDPFPTDVYTMGNLIKRHFTEGYKHARKKLGLEFMDPLVADMTNPDPSKRPTMDEVVERFEKIRKGLSSWKLRSRVIKADEIYVVGVVRSLGHLARRAVYMVKGVPAIPSPS